MVATQVHSRKSARLLQASGALVRSLHGWARLAVAGYVAGGLATAATRSERRTHDTSASGANQNYGAAAHGCPRFASLCGTIGRWWARIARLQAAYAEVEGRSPAKRRRTSPGEFGFSPHPSCSRASGGLCDGSSR